MGSDLASQMGYLSIACWIVVYVSRLVLLAINSGVEAIKNGVGVSRNGFGATGATSP